MKRFILMVAIVCFVVLARPAWAVVPRIALVIGNSGYKIAPSLANPANDAKLMAETLRSLGFDVIERIDADRETIQLATFELQDRLIAAGKGAVGLFFYAGHGVQVAGENYLIPLKTEIKQEREIAVKAVSASFVLKQMEFAENGMNFVILDACRNNPFPASTRAATRGLARMNAPTGSLVAYSTGPGEVAIDGTGDNSPYVLALSEAMLTSDVPAEIMFKRVREKVLKATDDKQTPWEESSLKGGDFYFNEDGPGTTAAGVVSSEAPASGSAAVAAQQETLFWNSILDANSADMFEAYLAQYPTGTFATLARLRIKLLEEKPTVTAALTPEPVRSLSKQEMEGDEDLKSLIIKFFDKQRNIRYKSGYSSTIEMAEINTIEVLEISGKTITARVKYRWQATEYTSFGRSESGLATVERIGSSYKVVDFE